MATEIDSRSHHARVMRLTNWHLAYLFVGVLVFIADQMTKAWAIRELAPGAGRHIIKGLLAFVYAENTGIAFGGFQSSGSLQQWLLIALAGVAFFAVMVYFFRTPNTNDRLLGACALLAAGILGNLVDRARLGFVVDFILVYWRDYQYPVFNIADASICIGAGLLILDAILSGRKQKIQDRSQESGVRSRNV